MKNKILAIAITAALTSLSTGAAMADNNKMTVTQDGSVGSINATQGGMADEDATSNSSITIHQEGAIDGTGIVVTQTAASGVHADIIQYQSETDAGASTITINQSGGTVENGNYAYISQGGTTDASGAFTAGTNSGNNFTVNHQNGSGNTIAGYGSEWTEAITVEGEGEGERTLSRAGHASQTGTMNKATLSQNGTNNLMGFGQDGNNNVAILTQSEGSAESSLNLMQAGDGNFVTVQQGSERTTNSHIDISVTGDNNSLGNTVDGSDYSVSQLSSDSNINIIIMGDSNKANVSQAVGADGSEIMLTQDGKNNEALMSQSGLSNSMDLTQNGDGNMATLAQNGANDSMALTQSGGSTVHLTQN